MKKIITTALTATLIAPLFVQTASAHEGHHESGLTSLLAHLSANPDHWAVPLILLVITGAGYAWHRRRRDARNMNSNGSSNHTH